MVIYNDHNSKLTFRKKWHNLFEHLGDFGVRTGEFVEYKIKKVVKSKWTGISLAVLVPMTIFSAKYPDQLKNVVSGVAGDVSKIFPSKHSYNTFYTNNTPFISQKNLPQKIKDTTYLDTKQKINDFGFGYLPNIEKKNVEIKEKVDTANKINYNNFLNEAHKKGITGMFELAMGRKAEEKDYVRGGSIDKFLKGSGIELRVKNENGEEVFNDMVTEEDVSRLYSKIQSSEDGNDSVDKLVGGNDLTPSDYQKISQIHNSSKSGKESVYKVMDIFSTLDYTRSIEAIAESRTYSGVENIKYRSLLKDNIDSKTKANFLIDYLSGTNNKAIENMVDKNDIKVSNVYSFIKDAAQDESINKILSQYNITASDFRKTKLDDSVKNSIIHDLTSIKS